MLFDVRSRKLRPQHECIEACFKCAVFTGDEPVFVTRRNTVARVHGEKEDVRKKDKKRKSCLTRTA